MNEFEDFTEEKDVFVQEISPSFIIAEEVTEKPEKIDYSKIFVLPTIKARYISMLIDVLIIFLISLAISSLFEIKR